MKFLFLVGSAIKHFQEKDFSAYTEEQRFEQTLKTIESIKNKVPQSYIILFECSYTSISERYKEILRTKCDLVLDFYNEPIIKQIYENIKKRPELIVYGKSLLETRGLLNALYTIQKHNIFNDSQRVFKITGRYLLNDNFNIKDYESTFLEGKYIIKRYSYSLEELQNYNEKELNNIYAYLYGAKGSMVTGLWSFDRLLFSKTIEYLEKSFFYMEKMMQYTSGIDIEHSLYKFLEQKNIIETPNLGLSVIKGMSGDNGGIYEI